MDAETADPYRVLGVARTASPAEVRRAYLRLARAQASGADAARARRIDDAYLLLSDPAARWRYDEKQRAAAARERTRIQNTRRSSRGARAAEPRRERSPVGMLLMAFAGLILLGAGRACLRQGRYSEERGRRQQEFQSMTPEQREEFKRKLMADLLESVHKETRKLRPRERTAEDGASGAPPAQGTRSPPK